MSVREVERRVQAASRPRRARRKAKRRTTGETPEIRALRERAERQLGSPVNITRDAKTGRGEFSVKFYSDTDLTRLLDIMGIDTDLS
jgi:hypothetical protein